MKTLTKIGLGVGATVVGVATVAPIIASGGSDPNDPKPQSGTQRDQRVMVAEVGLGGVLGAVFGFLYAGTTKGAVIGAVLGASSGLVYNQTNGLFSGGFPVH